MNLFSRTLSRRLVRTACALTLLLAFALQNAQAAQAESLNTSFSIRAEDPADPWVALELQPGAQSTFSVFVGNHGEETATAVTYAADIFTLINGGMGVGLDGEPVSGATTWIDYQRQELKLEGGTETRIDVPIAVPADTPPGEYEAALVVQPQVDALRDEQSDPDLLMLSRNAMAVTINVPGERQPELSIGMASATIAPGASVQTISVALENTGNVRLKPAATLELTAPDGSSAGTYPIALDTLYAGRATTMEWSPGTELDAGTYQVSVAVTAPDEGIEISSPPQEVIVADVPDPATPEPEVSNSASGDGSFSIGEGDADEAAGDSGSNTTTMALLAVIGVLALIIVGGGAWVLGQRAGRNRQQPQPPGGDA